MHRLAAALAIGLLVGTERHWRERQEAAGRRTVGVRTFALTGLLGGVMAALAFLLGQNGGALLLGLGLAALLAAQLPFALREADAENKVSATSLVAALGTYSLGALAVLGDMAVAGAAAVAMTAILAARESLHGLMARITWAELRSALVLLSMTLLVMPLVPDEPISLLGGLNPAKIWRFAILLAAISYLGYLAVRLLGPERGLLFSGAAGGLVSSTAVTLANARAAAGGARLWRWRHGRWWRARFPACAPSALLPSSRPPLRRICLRHWGLRRLAWPWPALSWRGARGRMAPW